MKKIYILDSLVVMVTHSSILHRRQKKSIFKRIKKYITNQLLEYYLSKLIICIYQINITGYVLFINSY